MKTLFQIAATLAALTVPASAFEPIPFSLNFPTESRSKALHVPSAKVSRQNPKDVPSSNVAPENLAKSARGNHTARYKKHAR